MNEKPVRLLAEHVGELIFDGVRAVAASLNVGYPKIKRITSDSVAMYSENTDMLRVGSSELVFEGYLLGEGAVRSGAETGAQGTQGAWSGVAARRTAGHSRLADMKALLLSLCAPGQEFFLEVGTRRRALYASELTFSSEGPFGTDTAEKFCLRAFSDMPFFHGGDITFGGAARTQSALSLPASSAFSTALREGACDITVKNDGDEVCGFVMEVEFPEDTLHFMLSSNRDSQSLNVLARISAGERVLISTVPGDRYVKKASGHNLISSVNEGCVFHMLPPGETVLTFRSYTSLPPIVQGRFTPGYLIP